MDRVRKFGIWERSELGIEHDVRRAFRSGAFGPGGAIGPQKPTGSFKYFLQFIHSRATCVGYLFNEFSNEFISTSAQLTACKDLSDSELTFCASIKKYQFKLDDCWL